MIYVTSDLHFCHNKDFLYSPRGFQTVEEMNEAIVQNWNSHITAQDDVYVLGDLMLSDDVKGMELLNQLNGHIHIVRGNHDSDRRIENYKTCEQVVEIANSIYLTYQGYHFYMSHYPTLTSNFDYDKPIKARLINLCGHTHTSSIFDDWDKYNAPIVHCELDAHQNCPISLDDILIKIRQHEKLAFS